MEDNSPSWEPSFWQKCCPYPLCPSFRQFARLISLIIIGEYRTILAGHSPSAYMNVKRIIYGKWMELQIKGSEGGWTDWLTLLTRCVVTFLVVVVGWLACSVGW